LGSTAAVCWREPANLELPNKVFFRSGFALGALDDLSAISALAAGDSKFVTPSIRMIWPLWCSSRWIIQGRTVRLFAICRGESPIPCRFWNLVIGVKIGLELGRSLLTEKSDHLIFLW
jgi:hypothetical protein